MRTFEVFGKQVKVDEKDIAAYEEAMQEKFDNVTCKYLVNALEGKASMSSEELGELVRKSIAEEIRIALDVSKKAEDGTLDRLAEAERKKGEEDLER